MHLTVVYIYVHRESCYIGSCAWDCSEDVNIMQMLGILL